MKKTISKKDKFKSVKIINSLNLENLNREKEIKNLSELTPRSLALSVYKIYLDLGMETLNILKSEGLKPHNTLLDLGPRFLTSCYISTYLNPGKYFTLTETINEINSLEICDTYVEMITGTNRNIDCLDMTLKEFCDSTLWNERNFNYILLQRNLATLEDNQIISIFFKISRIIENEGKILAHYVENFPSKPGGCPILEFKRVLGILTGMNLSVRTLPYPDPINLRILCIKLKK
jgi:hypothetical protein